MNYLILINKTNLMNNSYYNNVKMVECNDILGESIKIEIKTYESYLRLKKYLKSKNIFIDIASAYRTFNEQQNIIDEYTKKYGTIYTNKYVAPVGASEHHTGLAIDLGLIINNEKHYEDEDLFNYDDIYKEIHKCLSDFGFIHRYPNKKENITGYNYEPWHIRYVGDIAKYIYDNNLTLEEFIEEEKS